MTAHAESPSAQRTRDRIDPAYRKPVTVEVLRALLQYDPTTGVLTWNARPEADFPSRRLARTWNSRYAGKPALIAMVGGYRHGTIFDHHVRAHRVAWAMTYGAWPEGEIDHINGDRSDNRIENLRLVTVAENMRNTAMSKRNSSGVVGVSYDSARKCWRAQAKSGRIRVSTRHRTFEEAVEARRQLSADLSFHENHGRSA